MGLQSSLFDIISLITLFITDLEESYEPFSWNEIVDVD